MSVTVTMPALSPTMTEGNLVKWLVKVGDKVRAGDALAEVETDKATMELEAAEEGTVGQLLVDEGAQGIPVNTPLAVLLVDGEKTSVAKGTPSPALSNGRLPAGASPTSQIPASGGGGEGGLNKTPSPESKVLAPESKVRAPESKVREGGQKPKTLRLEGRGKGEGVVQPPSEVKFQTVREALRDAMAEEMRRDPRVFLMGEEVAHYQGAYKVSQGLLDEFGEARVVDTPITEYGFAGLGVGAAFAGLKPIVEFMTFNFAMQAIDHIVNSAAKTRYMSGGQIHCPVVFRGPNGAASRVAAQHSQNYAPWFANVPGLKVVAPCFAADAKGLLKAAIRDDNPVVFLENELLYGDKGEVPEGDVLVPIGKAKVVCEGKDVTIVAYSIAVKVALKAAEQLAEEGIDAEVIDLRTLRPLDMEAVTASLAKTNRLVVVEEGWPQCSIASEISARVMEEAFDNLDAPVLRVTDADVPMPYAASLEKMALISADGVVAAVKKVTDREGQ